jgi:hypothetical protein
MNATTKVIALATGAALSIAGGASAHGGHGGHHATVYGAKLAKAAAVTDSTYAELAGRAHLVDGGNHNPLVVHVRHLKPNTAYTFELSTAACDQPSATVADFAVTNATSNEAGKLRGKADSATFNAADGTTYFVVVKEGATAIACGQLDPKKTQHGFFKLHKRHKHSGPHQGQGRAKKAGDGQDGDPGHGCGDKQNARRA